MEDENDIRSKTLIKLSGGIDPPSKHPLKPWWYCWNFTSCVKGFLKSEFMNGNLINTLAEIANGRVLPRLCFLFLNGNCKPAIYMLVLGFNGLYHWFTESFWVISELIEHLSEYQAFFNVGSVEIQLHIVRVFAA